MSFQAWSLAMVCSDGEMEKVLTGTLTRDSCQVEGSRAKNPSANGRGGRNGRSGMLQKISKRRFDALAGYSRTPRIMALTEELEWYATADERVLGIVLRDRIDDDFSWVAMGRDETLRFRAVKVRASHPSQDEARQALFKTLEELAQAPDEEFYQSDTTAKPVDFFKLMAPEEKLHPSFKLMSRAERYLPARDLITSLMRYHKDLDGNFVQQFQTTAFDARLWELYLFATFVELGFARHDHANVPDFVLGSNYGPMAIEATTVNPPDGFSPSLPKEAKDRDDYISNYMPIKLGRAMKAKLAKKYWEAPHMKGVPFVLAVQDFSFRYSMTMIDAITVDYVYGYRHVIRNGLPQVEKIGEFKYKTLSEPAGFFDLPGAENVSAVLINPLGTLPKFNRMGYLAGFGPRDIRMIRSGIRRNLSFTEPLVPFVQDVTDSNYKESWIEGAVVLHNRRAKVELAPGLIPGALHKRADENGDLESIEPDFHPIMSRTAINAAEADEG